MRNWAHSTVDTKQTAAQNLLKVFIHDNPSAVVQIAEDDVILKAIWNLLESDKDTNPLESMFLLLSVFFFTVKFRYFEYFTFYETISGTFWQLLSIH